MPDNVSEIDLFQVALSQKEKLASILNAGVTESTAIGLMAATPNIQAFSKPLPSSIANRKGCSQQFKQDKEAAKLGKFGVRFTATCDEQKAGLGEKWEALSRSTQLVRFKFDQGMGTW